MLVDIDGVHEPAVAYDDLTGPVRAGDTVLLNTTARALGLGTGGVHFVIAVEGAAGHHEGGHHEGGHPEAGTSLPGHAMKLRYTPAQTAVEAVEERYRDAIDRVRSLNGLPVVVAGLHSALAPAAIGARSAAPNARIAFVMSDGGALMMAFSETVPALRAAGLIDCTISAGQSTGGDYEAVTLHGALAAARAVVKADIVIVAMGPGNLGTASRWGFALIETAAIVNAVSAMGGRPIVVPRLSFADQRERHQGISHHTLTALGTATLARAEIVLPTLSSEHAATVRNQLAGAPGMERHAIVEVDLIEAEITLLRNSPAPLRCMGRAYDDDPDCFRAAAAAGIFAARASLETGSELRTGD